MASRVFFAPLFAALLLACHADEEGNRAPRCLTDADCSQSRICYRSFCVGNEEHSDDDAVTDDEDAGDAGSTAIEDASEPVVDAASGGGASNAPAPNDGVATTPTPDAAVAPPAPTPPTPTMPAPAADASAPPPAAMPDAGAAPAPSTPGSLLPWPLGIPLDGVVCLVPCTTFDEKGCRECVQKLKLDPESLCLRDSDDYGGSVDPGFLGLRAAICTTLCPAATKGQDKCRRAK